MREHQRIKELVAIHVMGWTPIPVEGKRPMWRTPDGRITGEADVPNYPGEIAAAWMVVKRLSTTHWWVIKSPFYPGAKWNAGLTPHNTTGWNGVPDHNAAADTEELAICLAALRALGVAIPEEE